MSDQYVGEIRILGFEFAPSGWARCDGQLLPINQNPSLYMVVGTTYGGDGRNTFALPDLRGRIPIHRGNGASGATYYLGQAEGEDAHTLAASEVPGHSHNVLGTDAQGTEDTGSGNLLARTGSALYVDQFADNKGSLNVGTIAPVGGQPHNNVMPSLALPFYISLKGTPPPDPSPDQADARSYA